MEDWKKLRAGIDGQPEPQQLCGAAQPGAQFIQLQMRELEIAEEALVQGLCMCPSATQPDRDGRLSVPENPFGGGRAGPFRQRREHHGDLVSGGFQPVEGRVAPGSEDGVAGLTTKALDALGLAMLAIAHQGMNGSVGDPEVRTLPVGTGEAIGLYPLRGPPPAFHLRPRTYQHRCWPSA